jgi:hypothetical protein
VPEAGLAARVRTHLNSSEIDAIDREDLIELLAAM